MQDDTLHAQAALIESLLPQLARRLFPLAQGHPVTELPQAQRRVCNILQGGPRTLTSLSEELGISVSATTQIADRLERADLVERVADTLDRRIRYLRLTAHGDELMRIYRQGRVQQVTKALALVPPEMRESVLEGVCALLEAAQAVASPHPSDETLPADVRELSPQPYA